MEKDQVLSLDRLRAGEDHPTTTYILNETPWSVDMYIKGAAAAGLHDEAVSDIGVRTDGVPSVICS